jgi:hypothetical protein
MPLRPKEIRPRLRIEPCPTFYLRTARAYSFLQNFLHATIDKAQLAKLHGLKQDGLRPLPLDAELEAIRQRFYGLYFITCEDIGMSPVLLEGEPVEPAAAKAAALEWLSKLADDPDLACDTRVSVPIFVNYLAGKTRIWATLGVHLAPLKADYARAPKVRPKKTGGDWQDVERELLDEANFVIPVDEFAEIELPGSRALSRGELRAACDRYKTKEAIVEALAK